LIQESWFTLSYLTGTNMEAQAGIRDTIKKNAKRGDYPAVAAIVGLKADTVRKVVNGKRHNERVLKAFQALLKSRADLGKKFNKEAE
jgi:hypothetical protein